MGKRPVVKNRPAAPKAAPAARRAANSAPVPAFVLAFGCGTGTSLALLAAFAFVLERFSLPLAAVQPMAVAAAWVGAAVSGWVLGSKLGRLRLVCGAGCGLFYCLCLLLAAFVMRGTVALQGAGLAVPVALLLGGIAGGTVSALHIAGSALPH